MVDIRLRKIIVKSIGKWMNKYKHLLKKMWRYTVRDQTMEKTVIKGVEDRVQIFSKNTAWILLKFRNNVTELVKIWNWIMINRRNWEGRPELLMMSEKQVNIEIKHGIDIHKKRLGCSRWHTHAWRTRSRLRTFFDYSEVKQPSKWRYIGKQFSLTGSTAGKPLNRHPIS